MRVCLATLAIGESYIEEYNRLFRPSQQLYAERHGYDFKVITNYLSELQHPDTISFHKYLIACQDWAQIYDFVIYLDADVLVNPKAPILPFDSLGDKIGMVDEYSQPTPDRRIAIQIKNGWETTATDYMKLHGPYDFKTTKVFNGGIMVFQPSKHRELCQYIFSTYAKQNIGHSYHFEQSTTNYELQGRDLIKTLPNEFNAIFAIANMDNNQLNPHTFFITNHFVHFAGKVGFDIVSSIYENSTNIS
jgi:lipopolysaccharide biosynthesis glycosyltransferase